MEMDFSKNENKNKKQNIKVGFIGTGKAATALGAYLFKKNIPLSGFFGRDLNKAEYLSKTLNCQSFVSVHEMVSSSDLIILAVNDSSIKSVAESIAILEGIEWSEKTFFHLSGALASSELESLKEKGANTASFHIIQALNGAPEKYLARDTLDKTWFSIEGDFKSEALAISILSRTENPYILLTPENKPLYHAALCMFSNYLVTLMGESCKMLESIGIDFENAWNLATPLINGTLDNITAFGPEKAITGPIARGDEKTLETHYAAISKVAPESLDFYKAMASYTKNFLGR